MKKKIIIILATLIIMIIMAGGVAFGSSYLCDSKVTTTVCPSGNSQPANTAAGTTTASTNPTANTLNYFKVDDKIYLQKNNQLFSIDDGTQLAGTKGALTKATPAQFGQIPNLVTFDSGKTVFNVNPDGKISASSKSSTGFVNYEGDYYVDKDGKVSIGSLNDLTPYGELTTRYVNGKETAVIKKKDGTFVTTNGEQISGSISGWGAWANSFGNPNNQDGLANTFSLLSGISQSLDGYPYISMYFKKSDEDMLIGKADNAFYTKVLGGKEFAVEQLMKTSPLCRNAISNLEDSTPVMVGGSQGGETASAWIAGEKIPYNNYASGTNESGYIYKISAEVNYGACKELTVQLFLDNTPLILQDGTTEAYTFFMGTDTASQTISYTGQGMITFFSKNNYDKACISFIQPTTNGCLLNVFAPKRMCVKIATSDVNAAAYASANPPPPKPKDAKVSNQGSTPGSAPENATTTPSGDPIVNKLL